MFSEFVLGTAAKTLDLPIQKSDSEVQLARRLCLKIGLGQGRGTSIRITAAAANAVPPGSSQIDLLNSEHFGDSSASGSDMKVSAADPVDIRQA